MVSSVSKVKNIVNHSIICPLVFQKKENMKFSPLSMKFFHKNRSAVGFFLLLCTKETVRIRKVSDLLYFLYAFLSAGYPQQSVFVRRTGELSEPFFYSCFAASRALMAFLMRVSASRITSWEVPAFIRMKPLPSLPNLMPGLSQTFAS